LCMPPEISELMRFWGPIDGDQYEYTWRADVTWGGSFGGHGDDEAVWASGIWKPQDTEHFMTHDDHAGVATIGRWGQDWPMLQLLIDQQQNGELIPGMMYTAIVFEGQSQLVYPNTIPDFEAGLLEVMGRGDIVWMGLTEQYEEWQTTYNSVPNIHRFIGHE